MEQVENHFGYVGEQYDPASLTRDDKKFNAEYERNLEIRQNVIAAGYYQDANGRWHKPNGEFASNAEVGVMQIQPEKSLGSRGQHL